MHAISRINNPLPNGCSQIFLGALLAPKVASLFSEKYSRVLTLTASGTVNSSFLAISSPTSKRRRVPIRNPNLWLDPEPGSRSRKKRIFDKLIHFYLQDFEGRLRQDERQSLFQFLSEVFKAEIKAIAQFLT